MKAINPRVVAPFAAILLYFSQQLPSAAATIVLYDDTQGNVPAGQSWFAYANDAFLSGGSVSQSAINGVGVGLNSDNAVSAGYSNYLPFFGLRNADFPELEASAGFRLSFELQITNEVHLNDNRAGFSVIALNNQAQGVELGFWEEKIWAQRDDPLFTHGEEADFDTSEAEVSYDLDVFVSGYRLFADGDLILDGMLRDYSDEGNPYDLPNFIFLGDDTGSAGANIVLGEVVLENPVPVPAPAAIVLFLSGISTILLNIIRTGAIRVHAGWHPCAEVA